MLNSVSVVITTLDPVPRRAPMNSDAAFAATSGDPTLTVAPARPWPSRPGTRRSQRRREVDFDGGGRGVRYAGL